MSKYKTLRDKDLIELIRASIVAAGDEAYDKGMEQLAGEPEDTQQDMWRLAEKLLDIAYNDFDYMRDVPEIKVMIDEAHRRNIKVHLAEDGFMMPKDIEDEF